MKTEKEIREEIEATKRTKENHRKAYENGKMPREVWVGNVCECNTTIVTLKWVLGENDRYD